MNQIRKEKQMITLKKLFIPILCVVVFSLTSCLKDDDSDTYTFVPLTQQEKSEQIQKMQGNYKGCVYYNLNNYSMVFTDSAKVEWMVSATDSMLTIRNFPMKIFANNVNDPKMKEALLNDSVHSLEARIYLYRPWGTSGKLEYSYFNCIPYGTEELKVVIPMKIDYEIKNVTFVFDTNYQNRFYATGVFDNKKDFSFNTILKQIIVENGSYNSLNELVGFYGYRQ